jgi:hypothetical protein
MVIKTGFSNKKITMKSSGKIIGVFLMLLISGKCSLNAQRGSMDTTHMTRPWIHHMEMSEMRHMQWMNHSSDSMKMGGMRHGFDTMNMRGMRHYMFHGWMEPGGRFGFPPPMYYGMRDMWRMDHFGPGHFGADRLRIESIPNLTDKQKKEIADLRQKHLDDMKKLRDEMTEKIQDMRKAHRKDMLNLLTDEQKKYMESGSENTNTGSSKQK